MAEKRSSRVHEGADAAPELIDPIWILKMLGGVVVVAAICAYLTIMLLFWQGAWQLVLHPERDAAQLQVPGAAVEAVHFDADELGQTRLNGWWISSAAPSSYAVLYLRGGDGELATDAGDRQRIAMLRSAGLNVFGFDYRGYGTSVKLRPSEKSMSEDVERTFDFLTTQKGYLPDHVLLFGAGIGGPLAAQLSVKHTSVAALVLDQPDATALERVMDDKRGKILPARLLYRDRFDLIGPLARSQAAKLLMLVADFDAHAQDRNEVAVHEAYFAAASPKTVTVMGSGAGLEAQKVEALRRFLDEYLIRR